MDREMELLIDTKAQTLIKTHEGYSNTIYADSVGVLTVGFGHALLPGSKMSHDVCAMLFEEDYAIASETAMRLIAEYGVPMPNMARLIVLIDMAFNLGYNRLKLFRNMWQSLKLKDYNTAADEMLHSRWAMQVKSRAVSLADAMRKGTMPNA